MPSPSRSSTSGSRRGTNCWALSNQSLALSMMCISQLNLPLPRPPASIMPAPSTIMPGLPTNRPAATTMAPAL